LIQFDPAEHENYEESIDAADQFFVASATD